MGYRRCITYTLAEERGDSVRASNGAPAAIV